MILQTGQRTDISAFYSEWFVTITPYGRDIEPAVPDKMKVMEGFKKLLSCNQLRSNHT